jgi:hypothetical protein
MSTSSMQSAPAHIAATSVIALSAGFAPVDIFRFTCRRIDTASSHRSAKRTTGTRPEATCSTHPSL